MAPVLRLRAPAHGRLSRGSPVAFVARRSPDDRRGIRWYNESGKLARRFVTQDVAGAWTLSATAVGPTVSRCAHANWRNVYAVPGEDSTGPMVTHGDFFTVQAPVTE